ncbi:MAG: preprotein translocase subunit SecA [Bdellovibrionota bacterium]
MLSTAVKKIFGSKNDRELKKIYPIVDQINRLESSVQALSDEQLKNKTVEFRQHIADERKRGKKDSDILNALLPQAFAVCREAGKRVLNMRHFDVQLIGGYVLHQGRIAEMRTGEGKTLVATLPVYLNALLGRGVHVVTVNDYLAKRDSTWMGQLYNFLGLTVGCVVHELNDQQRQEAYRCDVTYGQNNEFGFDYLRDNMKYRLEDYVQRELYFAIVDEVDSILIDEARTPLIISGPTDISTDKYYKINQIIPQLKKDIDYTVDEKARTVLLTEDGMPKVEKLLGVENLYDPTNMETLHHVNQGLKAHTLYQRDVDYMVKDDEVVIVDEFTGRLMPGRRWSDGLHQAVEAKEGVTIANENQTLASISFQNYFRLFEKLAGMTGTADTEAEEFGKIYNLDVMVIPTNRPMIRKDHPDTVFATENDKIQAIVKQIKEANEIGQPVLVGTISIEKSELLSKHLTRNGIKHNVLNAKHHEREAEIVKDAGQPGQITIATNMAGRGTDIVLGEGVKEKGGLFILGTERHESRRIDNQLRGRAGRQGDPGNSRFYLSLQDDLMRIFASDRVQKIMQMAGFTEGEAIESRIISRSIATAQKRVEGHNFDIRKHLLKYDDVMNQQRKIIYALRKDVLGQANIRQVINSDIDDVTEEMILNHTQKGPSMNWDWSGLNERFMSVFGYELPVNAETFKGTTQEDLHELLMDHTKAHLNEREKSFGNDEFAHMVEREIKLRTIDSFWKDHLYGMDQLRDAVGFEGYAQKDPLNEYKKRGFAMFADVVYGTKEVALQRIFHVQVTQEQAPEEIFEKRKTGPVTMTHASAESTSPKIQASGGAIPNRTEIPNMRGNEQPVTIRRDEAKVGRNDPCPCGSGKKYKKCHGA